MGGREEATVVDHIVTGSVTVVDKHFRESGGVPSPQT